ncbi:PRD domain-containing protein [Peribacillus sp. SCS-37]|uniref:PRD domain-containing protein n=1 Tax=Paraperibacillus esterisolvens TaxID=3115296 RepID=UPI00390595B7
MDASLKERLDLLHDTNQISDKIYDRLPVLLDQVEAYLDVKLAEENAGSFASHLSVALQRISENNPVSEISEELETVIAKNPEYYQNAKEFLQANNPKGANIDAEAAFITLYFGLLTGKGNE